jgi:ATP-binding cassette subfamily F protein uup
LSGGIETFVLVYCFDSESNFLDEPTNDLRHCHLKRFGKFLLDYPGCLLVVDRYFMDKIVDHLFIFRGDGVVEDFPGNYSDFRATKTV